MDEIELVGTLLAPPEASDEVAGRSMDRLRTRMRTGPVRDRRKALMAGGAGLGLAAAVAAAAVVVASGDATPGERPHGPPSVSAPAGGRQVLLAAAGTAARSPETSGTYWYVKTVIGGRTLAETWQTDDRSWIRSAKAPGKLVEVRPPRPFRLAGEQVTAARLRSLPTEPAALRAWIERAVRHSDARTSSGALTAGDRRRLAFDSLVALVGELPAPPKVRAAALRAIADMPDVRSLGPVQGGEGLSIGGRRLVVDPATGRIRGTDFLVTMDGAEGLVNEPGGATVIAYWTDTPPR